MDPLDSSARLRYRPDIDGLRAVAVLLVLLNHVGVQRVTGGFVGVDVFFVISGYLISALIVKEIDGSRFSLLRFYERRFRRILPALLVMLAVTTVFAYRYLFPPELKGFALSERGALFSFSNVVFWQQSGYFEGPSRLKPLLHTWSLGVEEQFYVVFPLLLIVLCRWARRWLNAIVWLLTIATFLLAWYWTGLSAPAAFYLAPLRAWEFLVGTLLALSALPFPTRPWQRTLAGCTGIFLIFAAALHFTDTTKFPGFAALWPCVGAALVILGGETGDSAVKSALSWGPVRFIGLISYSLYLWHWPIQVFQTTNAMVVPDRYPSWVAKAAVIVVSIVVATISWRLVEQPFRTGIFRKNRVVLFASAAVLMGCLTWFSGMEIAHGGWTPVPYPRPYSFYDYDRVNPGVAASNWGTCYMEPQNFPASFQASFCLKEVPGKKQYLVIGDSHAAALYPGLKAVFPEINVSQLTTTGCQPLLSHPGYREFLCDRAANYTFGDYLVHHPVDTVVLVARWHAGDMPYLADTVAWIQQHGMKVIVVGPSIEFDRSLPRLLEVAHRDHDPAAAGRHRVFEPQDLDTQMKKLARDVWHVPYVSMYDDLCNLAPSAPDQAAGCPVYGDKGIYLLWDTDHFSVPGATLLAQAMRAHGQMP